MWVKSQVNNLLFRKSRTIRLHANCWCERKLLFGSLTLYR